jgi:hypothetical protein
LEQVSGQLRTGVVLTDAVIDCAQESCRYCRISFCFRPRARTALRGGKQRLSYASHFRDRDFTRLIPRMLF